MARMIHCFIDTLIGDRNVDWSVVLWLVGWLIVRIGLNKLFFGWVVGQCLVGLLAGSLFGWFSLLVGQLVVQRC